MPYQPTKENDHIDGKKGNDIVKGIKGNDALFGSKGRDQLYGAKGDDYLSGGSDDDILKGGSGADIFKLSSGGDQIIDFKIEDGDKIAIDRQHIGFFTVTSTDSGSLVSVEGYGSLEVDISLEGIDLVTFVVQAV
jgi:Ca2+-binding RTX toxin-like protein